MVTLAIDTASSACAICLKAADGLFYERTEDIGQGHAEVLFDWIDEGLKTLNLSYADLSLIAVNRGPGSFTGVRVGIAAARGLALALKIEARGVSTLKALFQDHVTEEPTLVALDAKRGELYAELFNGHEGMTVGPVVQSINDALPACWLELDNLRLIGSGAPLIAPKLPKAHLTSAQSCPSIRTIADLAEEDKATGGKPSPLYLRAPDAKPQTKQLIERAHQ